VGRRPLDRAVRSGTHGARPVTVEEASRGYRSGPATASAPHPVPGVYENTGSGTERLTLPPLSQPEGPSLPGTVELGADGCWRFRIDYSTNPWQTWTYCWHSAGLEEAEGQTWQKWLVGPVAITNLSTLHCDPGSMALPATGSAGQTWPARCVGTSTAVSGAAATAGPYRFVGEETLAVGGIRVRAAHFLRVRAMTGSQQGPEHSDVWFDDQTGLPIENRRRIEVRTDTAFGSSTYTETGSLILRSLTSVR